MLTVPRGGETRTEVSAWAVRRMQSRPAAAADTVVVTGCSSGLGLETALYLAERGLKVYATVRNLSARPEILQQADQRHVALEVLPLDVTDPASIEGAVTTIVGATGSIYALVNNAGVGLRGCLEDLSLDEVRHVYETNVFGAMAVTQWVLPHMRAAGRGRIVTISSVGGRISSFGLSAYCGSKFAQEGMAEALALEIAPFGLQSIIIEPGIIKTTRWTINRGTAQRAFTLESPYQGLFAAHEKIADRIVERSKTRPVDVARTVYHALTTPRPRLRYVVGRPAAAAILLRRYLPNELFERFYFGSLVRRLSRYGGKPHPQPLSQREQGESGTEGKR